MEGTHRIELLEPAATEQLADGSRRISRWTTHTVWAQRIDRGGGSSVQEDISVGTWDIQLRFRRTRALEGVSSIWKVRDSSGREYTVEQAGLVGSTSVEQQRVNRIFVFATARAPDLSDLPVE